MAKNVVGLFENPSDAQAALRDLNSAGFSGNTVSLVQTASDRLSGILEQLSIPQGDAHLYVQGVQNGGAFVVLQQLSDDDAYRAADILDRHNVVDIDSLSRSAAHRSETATTGTTNTQAGGTAQTTQTAGGRGMAAAGSGRRNFYEGGETVIPIVEEELRVGKREVEAGGVRVDTRVEETPVEEQVTLREERVNVERRPVERPASDADFDRLQEGTLEVHERREEPVVDKQARVVEEVVVGKEARERTETVQDTVRRTDVDVQETPGEARSTGYTETGRASTADVSSTGTTSSTRSDAVSGAGGSEGPIESTLGDAKRGAERATGLDLDRSGEVGDRDRRDNF